MKLNPGGWEGGATLDAAFEGGGEGDEGGGVGGDGGGFFRVGEVGARSAVAVPVKRSETRPRTRLLQMKRSTYQKLS